MGIPDYLTCLLTNLYVGQEATVRTGHGIADWFKIGKEVCQGCILSPCLFNLHAKCVCVCVCVCVCARVQAESFCQGPLFVTEWTVAHQVLLSVEFSRKEYQSGLPFSLLGVLPRPWIKPASTVALALAGGLFTAKPIGKHVQSSVQFSSVAQSSLTLCDPMDCNTPGLPVHHQLPEFTQTHVHWVGDAIQLSHLCHPLLLLTSIIPRIRVFSKESVLCIRWPRYWRFNFNISPSNEHPGLISFRMDWLDLLTVQGTLKSLLQNPCSEASILWYSAFFIVQLLHPYMTTRKKHSLD